VDVWNPSVKRDVFPDAGSHVAGPYRGVLHTTEGSSYAGARSAYVRYNVAPHFTIGTQGLWQHMPIDRAARALAHPQGTVETNRHSAVQIEVIWFAKDSIWVDQLVVAVRDLMIWIEQQTGIQPSAPQFLGSAAYGAHSPTRMSDDAWRAFNGWCGHQHVPHNDHWDPGIAPMGLLLQRSAPEPEPAPPPPPPPPADWTQEALLALPTLSIGASGQHVRILQALLIVAANDLMHEANIDGDFGPKTQSSLKTWQGRTNVLVADGVCGPATWRWLIGA